MWGGAWYYDQNLEINAQAADPQGVAFAVLVIIPGAPHAPQPPPRPAAGAPACAGALASSRLSLWSRRAGGAAELVRPDLGLVAM